MVRGAAEALALPEGICADLLIDTQGIDARVTIAELAASMLRITPPWWSDAERFAYSTLSAGNVIDDDHAG